MAGGEGTRLRPLTSNMPKPMMPLVNRPMMEHIVELLKRHGFDDIVVTVAFMPNAIRNYFGDGSEFGVRMVYASEETPLGTAGSVRNAMDELKETFLVISGDVLTDVDLGRRRRLPSHRRRRWPRSGWCRSRTRSSSASSSPARTGRSSASSRSRPGARSSPTPSTPASTCSSPRCSTGSSPTVSVDFSSDVFPTMLDDGQADSYGAVAKGYWEDVGTLDAYVQAHKDVLDGKVRGRDRRLPGRRRRVARRGRRGPSRRRAAGTGRRRATTASSTPARTCGEYVGARHRRPAPARRLARTQRDRRERLPRRGPQAARHGGRPGLRPASGRPVRGGRRCWATRCSSARTR